jgi:hypothetical protein
VFQQEVEMKRFAMLIAICTLCQSASAQTPECKSITDPGGRLACYDKTVPPAAAKPALRAAPVSKTEPKYVDTIGEEDAVMNARIKNICRGC